MLIKIYDLESIEASNDMEKNNPTISIIMPVYNGATFLAESIDSILAQTFTDWELIIVDDSSTDTSRAIADRYVSLDNRIRVYANTQEKGLAGALNCCLSHVHGQYIARADADDIQTPDRLQVEYDFLIKHPRIAIVGSWYKTFGNNKRPKVRKHPKQSVVIAWKYLSNTYFCHPTILFRASVLQTVSKYPLMVSEDFAFLSEVIHVYKGFNIPKVLLLYREHATNYSFTKAEAIKASIRDTFTKNFTYYHSDTRHIDAFYRFHASYRLTVISFLPILGISIHIARAILKKYDLQYNIPAIISISSALVTHATKAIANSIIRSVLGK